MIRRLVLFGFAGIASNTANIGAFWLCVNFIGLSVTLSGSIAYFLGMFVGFYMNHKFTFTGATQYINRFFSYTAIQLFIFCIYFIFNKLIIVPFLDIATFMHIMVVITCAIINFYLVNLIWGKHAKS